MESKCKKERDRFRKHYIKQNESAENRGTIMNDFQTGCALKMLTMHKFENYLFQFSENYLHDKYYKDFIFSKVAIIRIILCYMFFNTFQHNWKKNMNSFCLSVRALIHINMVKLPWKLYLLFWFTIECLVLKMKCVTFAVQLQRHSKELHYELWETSFDVHFNFF